MSWWDDARLLQSWKGRKANAEELEGINSSQSRPLAETTMIDSNAKKEMFLNIFYQNIILFDNI